MSTTNSPKSANDQPTNASLPASAEYWPTTFIDVTRLAGAGLHTYSLRASLGQPPVDGALITL